MAKITKCDKKIDLLYDDLNKDLYDKEINKLNIFNYNNKHTKKDLLQRYKQLNLICFSTKMTEFLNKNNEPKKGFGIYDQNEDKYVPPRFKNLIDFSKCNFRKPDYYNGHAIRTGLKINDTDYLILFDIDNKLNTINRFFKNILQKNNINYDDIKTPYAKTGNGGYHYIFKVHENKYKLINSQLTDIYIDNELYKIDIKCNNGLIYCEPTEYKSYDNKINKKYEWLNDSIYKYDILEIPEFLYNIILDNHNIKYKDNKIDTKKDKNINIIKIDININEIDIIPEKDLLLFNMLSDVRFDNRKYWINLCYLCYSLYDNNGFNLFNELSKKSSKYSENDIIITWKSILNNPKKYNYNSLLYWAKNDNPIEYEKYNKKFLTRIHKIQMLENINVEKIIINQRYLLDLETKLNNDSVLCNSINMFFNSNEYKSLNIKSPYNTGKTQTIKEILEMYNQKRVLWISYRITFTLDLMKTYEKYNFSNYQDGKLGADRIIIQEESLLKLCSTHEYIDDNDNSICCDIPTYDLIMLDECESLLNQFHSSKTFGFLSRDTFNYLYQIIIKSVKKGGKIISLDGDMSDRSYHYLNYFGKSLNIVNEFKSKPLHFQFVNHVLYFEQEICKAIDKGYNIVIPTMSSKYAGLIYTFLKKLYPKLKIKKYTSDTSGSDKKQLNNINKIWLDVNVLIYSPSIGAGVSFDIIHFDKIFAVMCGNSCSPRDFHQMLARIRQISDNNILIYNMQNFQIHNNINLITYEEQKIISNNIKNIKLQKEYIEKDNKIIMKYKFEKYDEIYCYNEVENSNKDYLRFLTIFIYMTIKKGYTYQFLDLEIDFNFWSQTLLQERKKIKKDNQHITKIIETKDIDSNEAEYIQLKTNLLENTEEESHLLKKYHIKLTLGLDLLDKNVLTIYDYKFYLIYNFCALIDEKNIICTTDNTFDNLLYEVPIINDLINNLGYKNIFDNETMIKKNIFINNINELKFKNIFSKTKENYKIFETSEKRINEMFNDTIDNLKNILGYINTILSKYCLYISLERIQNNYKKISYYKLNILNNVNELIYYKINRGFKLYDKNNIFIKPDKLIYNHLLYDETKNKWLKKDLENKNNNLLVNLDNIL